MEKMIKTIGIEDGTHRDLSQIKLDFRHKFKSFDDIIKFLLEKFKEEIIKQESGDKSL